MNCGEELKVSAQLLSIDFGGFGRFSLRARDATIFPRAPRTFTFSATVVDRIDDTTPRFLDWKFDLGARNSLAALTFLG